MRTSFHRASTLLLAAHMVTGPPAVAVSGTVSGAVPVAAGSTGVRTVTPAGFVYRSGRNLMLDGRAYRFAGFNAFGMTGCATGTPWTQAQLDDYFGGPPPAAMTRTWAFAHYGVDEQLQQFDCKTPPLATQQWAIG
ncbi:hypothetical protein Sru01_30410 [Sphaerisporangium rufum]|uniref:Secreted protein n=1 Tax=Sphaerisporangium rufum TaxID=1381558 RepID=A0A919UZS4_9ACTN|nr:hypothetical protein [Sphaerisporangium rufum]GII78059.1 hypothetical protein Sru01_30410 [Sphaerisporangium rufum]